MNAAVADINDAVNRLQGTGKSDQGLVASGQERVTGHSDTAPLVAGHNDTAPFPSLATGHQPLATSPAASPNSAASFLRTWLDELQIMFKNFAELVPELETTDLDTTDRRRLLGSGVRRYGFIEKVFEVSDDFPQFWPPFGEGRKELDEHVQEIDALRNLLVWFRFVTRVVQDMLLTAGDDAFRTVRTYYAFAREGARRKNPEAVQVFHMLQLFWKRPRRMNGTELSGRRTGEPTEKELERDFHALMRGEKDGRIAVEHESAAVSGSMRKVVDDVRSAKRRTQSAVCNREESE